LENKKWEFPVISAKKRVIHSFHRPYYYDYLLASVKKEACAREARFSRPLRGVWLRRGGAALLGVRANFSIFDFSFFQLFDFLENLILRSLNF